MSLIVGVTGGIGSGKSAATDHFASLNITIVDADLVSRIIVEPGRPALTAIVDHFGPDILQSDGQLDRVTLRQRVFADSNERQWLEQLTHPLIGEEIMHQLSQSKSAYTILASPLLLETTQKDLCDITVVVDVPEEVQLQRTMARDANDAAQVRRIMAAQMPRQQRLQLADEVIDNSGDLEHLYQQVEQLHQQFLRRCNA